MSETWKIETKITAQNSCNRCCYECPQEDICLEVCWQKDFECNQCIHYDYTVYDIKE